MDASAISRENIIIAQHVEEAFQRMSEKALFIVDRNVYEHQEPLQAALEGRRTLLFDAEESTKSLKSVETVYAFLMRHQREEALVAIGGGITGDVAGFAAATFKRGIPLIQMPTTLIAMADSAVGGKTGVNYQGVKNYIGAFRKPDAVYLVFALLETLPVREWRSGIGELLKYGFIADGAILDLLERGAAPVPCMEDARAMVLRGLAVKSRCVAEDFEDRGRRNILNFGHSIGHALEMIVPGLTHGEAVALGMRVELALSERKFDFPREGNRRLKRLMEKYAMPTRIPMQDPQRVLSLVEKDKKNDGHLRFTLLHDWSDPWVKVPVSRDEIIESLKEVEE